MVRLVEDRILVENISMHPTCQAEALKAGSFMAHGPSMDLSLPAVRETPQNLCLKIWSPKTRGYVVKITSYTRLTSCFWLPQLFSPHNSTQNLGYDPALSINTGVFSLPEFICMTSKNNRTGGLITSREYRHRKLGMSSTLVCTLHELLFG